MPKLTSAVSLLLMSSGLLLSGCATTSSDDDPSNRYVDQDSAIRRGGVGNYIFDGEAPGSARRTRDEAKDGFLVDHDEAMRRGGVGNIVLPTDYPRSDQARAESSEGSSENQTQASAAESRPPVRLEGKLLFDSGSAQLRPGALAELNRLGQDLGRNPREQARIDGYADATGTDRSNEQLSIARAKAVEDAMVQGGASRSQFRVRGHGESDPVASNNTAPGRASNRRVELHFTLTG